MIPTRFAAIEAQIEVDGPLRDLVLNGYAIIENAADPQLLLQMSRNLEGRFAATPFSVGPFHGESTKRFHRLLARSPEAQTLVTHNEILSVVKTLLGQWCDFPELSLTQGVEIHPGGPEQIPHRDQSMWPMPPCDMELCVNVFWPLVEFTEANGATRVWPGSHIEPQGPRDSDAAPTICTMKPGDALLVLGSTIHAAGANRSSEPRRAAIVSYCLGWLKAYENQSLAYSPEFVKSLDAELAALLGYRWHRPNLGTYDGQCPSILLKDDVPDNLATVDALSPEHERVVETFFRSLCPDKAAAVHGG